MEVYVEGNLIGAKTGEPWSVPIQFPNSLSKGFHDLTVKAIDDVGNRGSATVTINVNADPAPIALSITEPTTGSTLQPSNFPLNITVSANDVSNASKIDVYVQSPEGSTKLVGSTFGPTTNILQLQWNSPPTPGIYILYPSLTDKDGNVHSGERTTVTVL
jgi:hypothetical protein